MELGPGREAGYVDSDIREEIGEGVEMVYKECIQIEQLDGEVVYSEPREGLSQKNNDEGIEP